MAKEHDVVAAASFDVTIGTEAFHRKGTTSTGAVDTTLVRAEKEYRNRNNFMNSLETSIY